MELPKIDILHVTETVYNDLCDKVSDCNGYYEAVPIGAEELYELSLEYVKNKYLGEYPLFTVERLKQALPYKQWVTCVLPSNILTRVEDCSYMYDHPVRCVEVNQNIRSCDE